MKHSGRAFRSAIKLIFWTLVLLLAVFAVGALASLQTLVIATVSPAHGKVDVIDETTEAEFIGGPCKRISIFLSIFDVHVQKAPVSGKIAWLKQTPGKFLSATRADSAEHNENVLLGIEPADFPGQKVAVRLIAGVIARRIVPWVALGDSVARSERISLIQYGSRCDLYLPRAVKIHIKLGDKVRGGESLVASFE